MGAFFKSIFGGGRASTSASALARCHPLPEPVETDHDRLEPVATDALRLDSHWQAPTRRWVPAAEHAAAVLEFLQGPGGRTGSHPVDELKQLHIEICAERDWEPLGWTAVGRELRALLKDDKTYDKGKRVYHIPPLAGRLRLRAV
jgi:hypothetical protein